MAVEPDSEGVRFPPPLLYLGALLLGRRRSGSSPSALSASTGDLADISAGVTCYP